MLEDPLSEIEKEYISRYKDAGHKMQTGVAMKMQYVGQETTPKHLRVGVNSAMVDSGSLGGLLVSKGIITREEYLKSLAEGMEREADQYEKEVQGLLGNPNFKVTLG